MVYNLLELRKLLKGHPASKPAYVVAHFQSFLATMNESQSQSAL